MPTTMIRENMSNPVILGRYELLEQIGRGGFSTVYRAHDQKMDRQVAVKAVHRSEELDDRATREARAAAKLGNAHIVTVFELAEDDRNVYLVSELVEGWTLSRSISSRSLSDRDCLEITLQVLEALDHAHDRGVIHRDIKPDNIMLSQEAPPRVKVMDFGIAQLENTQRITRQGDVLGTIAYMSPEQADGRLVDSGTDVYSAALTLYECLTGDHPFRSDTAMETISRIHAGAPPLVSVRPDLPEELSDLLEEAMDADPSMRLGARSLAVGLEELLPELSGGEQATTVLRRADQQRPGIYEDLAGRYGFLAARIFNGCLAALVIAAASYDSPFYPQTWRLPLLFGAALSVALLPRIGLFLLAAFALVPVVVFSPALGAILSAVTVLYLLVFGTSWPRGALLPALAPALGVVGLGLVFPAAAGATGRLRRGLVLAVIGCTAMTFYQLLTTAGTLDYLGIANTFDLTARLRGEYNPLSAVAALASPFDEYPVLLVQPAIWLAAAIPAALLVKRRILFYDLSGLFFSNALLVGGYLSLPYLFKDYVLPLSLLKTVVLCVIIQVGLLLLSPRVNHQPDTLRERIKET
ncbi:MAG: serine/threonine-protein kinase [Thermoleophilia bacterium]